MSLGKSKKDKVIIDWKMAVAMKKAGMESDL